MTPTLGAYADAQARLEHAGGYRWRDGVGGRRCAGSVSASAELDRSLATFSGGELTRASLARALASKPDLLLLDEPTNHLDIDSLEWLERYLGEVDAAVVLVAHDRWFLESVGTSVLELEGGRGRYFDGPWHAWRAEQAARALAAGREIERSQAEIARMERFVERFRYKATKARQAQSKLKKIERVRARHADDRPARRALARVLLRRRGALGPGGARSSSRPRSRSPAAKAPGRRRALARARRARLPHRPQRLRQVDPGRDADRRARAAGGQAAPRPQRQARLPLASTPTCRAIRRSDRDQSRPALDRPLGGKDASPARALPVLRRGREKPLARHLRRRGAAPRAWRSSSTRTPTC